MAEKKVKDVKKVYRRRRRRYNKGNKRVTYPVAPASAQRICLKYTDTALVNLTNLLSAKHFIFRPNDLFDPDYTNTGHQSLFRDQMYLMYQYGRVCAFSFYVRIVSDSLIPTECILYRMPNVTYTDHISSREVKAVRKGLVTSNKPLTLKCNYLVDRFLETRKYTCLIDMAFKQASGAALPEINSCWLGLSQYYMGTSGSANIYFEWNIKQYSKFEEPLIPTQS